MSKAVWTSGIFSNYLIGNKQGLRWKYPNEEWTPADYEIPTASFDVLRRRGQRYGRGYPLPSEDIPKAAAIWNKKSFARTGDIFMIDTMYAVKPRLAEVLFRFDLGEGGLTPFTIYKEDLVSPVDEEFWLLNLCVRKDSFLPDKSNQADYRIRQLATDPETGRAIWKVSSLARDGDVVVSTDAFEGPDLWVEDQIWGRLFLSSPLVEALHEASLRNADFSLMQCGVLGSGPID